MYTVYSYWNADQLYTVLNAIAAIMNGGDYFGLLKAIAIGGMLTAAGTALLRMKGEEPLGYFIALAMFYGTLFVPRVTVTIQDLRTSTVYTVDNVPLGVAFFEAETSHIGKWLTETFETNFTPIDDERFAKTGMAFGAHLVEQLQLLKAATPALQQDLIAFVKDCVNPELLDNPTALNDMVKATDLWGFIGGSGSLALNPGRSTIIEGAAVPCTGSGGAYALLTTALNDEANSQGSALGDRLNPGNPFATTIILSQIPAIEGSLLNVSRTAQDSIKQSMVANMMLDSQITVAQMQGNPQAAQIALAVSMAEQSSAVSYAAMAKVAEGALPKLRNAIELLCVGVFPIVLLLIIMAGAKGGLVLRSYVMTVFWVQLWAPLFAIINFMATKSDQADLLGILHGAGGNTLANMGMLANTALSNRSIAGLLTISVPIIALALVKGGEVAMSGVVSSIMSPAQGAAQKAGDSVGEGNVNAGNVSWGNTNMSNMSGGNWSTGNTSFGNAGANKHDWSTSDVSSGLSKTTTAWGSYQSDGSGHVTGMQANTWGVGGSVSGGTTMSRSEADSSSAGVRASTGHSSSLDISSAASSSDRSSADFARQFSSALASRVGHSGQWGQQWSSGTNSSAQTEHSGQTALQNQQSERWSSTLGVRAGAGADQRYGPYGDGAGGSAGGMAGGSPGQANLGAGGQPATSAPSSGSNLPVPAGQMPASSSRAGPVTGSRNAGLNVGSGMEVTTAQALVDTATNKSGSVDQKSQQHAANIVMSAVNDVMANTNDAGVKSAAQAFAADLQRAVRAGDSRTAAVQQESSAGHAHQQGTSNQVGGSFTSGQPVAQQLLSMAGGDPRKALQLAQDPAAVAIATAAAGEAMKHSQAGGAMLAAGGATAPADVHSVAAKGAADVAGLAARGKGAVAAAHAVDKNAVATHQAASPDSTPNTGAATSGYTSSAGSAYAAYQQFSGDTAFAKGTTDAASALYQADQSGTGTVLANTFGFGMGYKSPQDYQDALTQASATRSKLADTLRHIGSSGGKVSPAAMDYLRSELKAHQDEQPGFFSKLVSAAESHATR